MCISLIYFNLKNLTSCLKLLVKRTWFTDQKVDYGNYEEGNMKVQHEMEMVRQQTIDSAPPPGYQEQLLRILF